MRFPERLAACSRTARGRGYSLIELVTVLALLGVVAAFAAPRFFSTDVFSARGYADELGAALRVAQKVAVASGCPVRLDIDATGYRGWQQAAAAGHCDAGSASWTMAVVMPDGQQLVGSAPADVPATTADQVIFDGRGQPLGGSRTFPVGPHMVTVEANSGFVSVR